MKNLLFVLLSGALVLGGAADAAKTTKKPAKKAPAKLICPVMGSEIKDKSKAPKTTYKKKTVYFCCASCVDEFKKDPEKYLKKTKKAEKPAKKAETVVCPVTNHKFEVAAAKGSSTHNGKTYHFCCGGCKGKFDADPAKYITKADDHKGHAH